MLFPELEDAQTGLIPEPADQPLAARLRPKTFDDYVGQEHLVNPGKMLRRAIEGDRFSSIILFGPPGIGKTTLAELIARQTTSHFERLSAVSASVKDIRRCVRDAVERRRRREGLKTILFIDEIHRFNRAQQDVLLPDVENGVIRLIGATTENPFFYIVGPLVSRSQVFKLEPLSPADIQRLLRRAGAAPVAFPGLTVGIDDEAVDFWAEACEGDARRALGALEVAVHSSPKTPTGEVHIDLATAEESMQQKALHYGDDGHYDTISAFIKSMRGSDPDAAVYWLAKMLHAGEDLRFIGRRLVIFAAEDVGNADPRALTLAVSAMQAVDMIGMPEARIILSQATTYCATCPKSNAAIKAVDKALGDVKSGRVQPVPTYLRSSNYAGAKRLGHGDGYEYPHDDPEAVSGQTYMAIPERYYEPVDRGYEARIQERLRHWRELRQERQGEEGANE